MSITICWPWRERMKERKAAVAAAAVARGVESAVGLATLGERLLVVSLALAAAGAVYVAACLLLRVEELKPVAGWLTRLRRGRRGAP